MPETIAIAADHAGFALKEILKAELARLGLTPEDRGTHGSESVDYPDFAHDLARWVAAEAGRRGVLICGSGIGMSIAANRHAGARAALCRTVEDATLARQHNDANIVCLGERVTPPALAKEILQVFLATDFEGGRHLPRVKKL